ncbi:uncharacterized protein LOC144101514 [Amblyomma americanum]
MIYKVASTLLAQLLQMKMKIMTEVSSMAQQTIKGLTHQETFNRQTFSEDVVEFARAMRAATDMMLSCKDYIMKLNLSPLILKEHRRLCIALRMCYAYSSYENQSTASLRRAILRCMEKMLQTVTAISPELIIKFGLNVTTLVKAATTCAYKHIPAEEKYSLAVLGYFADFISG